jgi:hypothetical protein
VWILAYLVSGEPRLLYDIAVLSVFGGAALALVAARAIDGARRRNLLAAASFAAVVAITATGLADFRDQVGYYQNLSGDRYAAVVWLASQTPSEPRSILVADSAGVPVGWWVEGMVGQEELYASNFRWLRFASELDRAKLANALLYQSGFPSPVSALTIRDADVHFVFLPSAAAFGINAAEPPPGWRVVFARGDAVVVAPLPTSGLGLMP